MTSPPSNPVYPDILDDDLWVFVRNDLETTYPHRFTLEHMRKAFEKTCSEYDDYVPLKHFIKRVRMCCVWDRFPKLKEPLES